jgi:pyrroline-5-carboxylate reductase
MSTSISGSGPAYIFMLMESMIDAGVHMGFTRETATVLAHHTLLGSTLYAMETGEHPAILRNMVTSPAGTTASAIYELENGKFRVVIKDVSICNRRYITLFIWVLTNNDLIAIIGNLGMLQESVRDGWPGI